MSDDEIPTSVPEPSADLEFKVKEDSLPLVPDDKYQVIYVGHDKRWHFGGFKLYVRFKIIDGPYSGVFLFRAYNFQDPLPRGSDLYKDLEFLHGSKLRKRTTLTMALFKNKVLEITTRTVTQDRKQAKLAEHRQYSVIDRIIDVVVGMRGGVR